MALRTPEPNMDCCGPRDPREASSSTFPVGGDVVDPGRLCSSYQRLILQDVQATSGWSLVPRWHSQWRIGQHDRRETRPRIGGPDGPGGVASSIITLLSLVKSPGDLDDSRAVCPISRTSMNTGAASPSYAH